MNKPKLEPKYQEIQKKLYEKNKIEETTEMDKAINSLMERISYMVAEGIQMSER